MQHLAMIMDGNRRWAKKNGLLNPYSKQSQNAIKTAISFCIKRQIPHLSLFAFSLENFNRDQDEQKRVFSLLEKTLSDDMDPIIKQGVKIRFIGDRSLFPSNVMPGILEVEKKSEHCSNLSLNILFCYGAQQELTAAMKSIAQQVQQGIISLDEISTQRIAESLWTSGTPNPDLIIRTSGVSRLSNFLLYQAAYSELAFLECYWPEITEAHIQGCVDRFHDVKRNFGK